jgi:hypothetical protein
MAEPLTSDELKAAGYEYVNDGTCRGCGAAIEWWITPGGKRMPMSVIKATDRTTTINEAMLKRGTDHRQSHFADCPDAVKFRRR